jgi:hypothetical protein
MRRAKKIKSRSHMWLVGIHMVLRGMSHMQLLGPKTVTLRFSKKKKL